MTKVDSLNFQDDEFDGTVEEESMFWAPKKSAKLLSDRNVTLQQDQGLEMQDIYYFRKNWLIIIMVNTVSVLLNVFYVADHSELTDQHFSIPILK